MPNPGQTVFPYVIVTTKEEYLPVAQQFAYKGVEVGCGAITFLSKSDFPTIYAALKAIGSGYALIQAEDINYFGDGNYARTFGNLY